MEAKNETNYPGYLIKVGTAFGNFYNYRQSAYRVFKMKNENKIEAL